MKPAIRRWSHNDLDTLGSFTCTASGAPSYARVAEIVIRECIDSLVAGEIDCLVADASGRIVGVIVFVSRDRRGSARVASMGVVPDRQNEGIGTDLKRAAMVIAAKAGATDIVSDVHRKNTRMQSVNRKLSIGYGDDPSDGKYLLYGVALVSGSTAPSVEGSEDKLG